MDLNKIVKKLSTSAGSIVDLSDIGRLVDDAYPDVDAAVKTRTYRYSSRLRDLGVLTPLKNGLFVVGEVNGPIDLFVDDHYWNLAKKVIKRTCSGQYMIVGAKSLELHSRNHEPPETLLVLTPRVNRVVTLSRGRTIVFQSVHEAAPKGAFHTCYSFSETLTIEGIGFRVCSREQALLETLTKRKGSQEVDVYLVERFLGRYAKYLRDSVVYDLVRIRYITAINRLRVITKKMGLNDVYSMCLVAIKRYGNGCFVSVDV